jgi:Tfp pilus assembly protein PilN
MRFPLGFIILVLNQNERVYINVKQKEERVTNILFLSTTISPLLSKVHKKSTLKEREKDWPKAHLFL